MLLAGDAAHVMPPTGAFGANTGIADAHNLAWKLAYVLKGIAHPNLLAPYENERQPVADLAVGVAVGLYAYRLPDQANRDAIQHSAEDMLSRVLSGPDATRPTGFSVIMGYRYRSAAILSEIEDNREKHEMFENQPVGRPGFRAPHIVLEHAGQHFSTHDLFGRSFVLLTGMEGEGWHGAARRVSERMGIPLETYSIGEGGDYIDVEGDFLDAYGLVTDAGAALIRPDGFMAWRAHTADKQAEHTLEQVFARLLCRQVEND